jgi:hypothetical protein
VDGQTYRRRTYTVVQKKFYRNISLLKRYGLLTIKEMFNLSFHAAIAGDRLQALFVLPSRLTGLLTESSYNTSRAVGRC